MKTFKTLVIACNGNTHYKTYHVIDLPTLAAEWDYSDLDGSVKDAIDNATKLRASQVLRTSYERMTFVWTSL